MHRRSASLAHRIIDSPAPGQAFPLDAAGAGLARSAIVRNLPGSIVTPGAGQIFITLVGGAAYVIPRRAFAGPEEADRFAETATAYWRAANAGEPR